MPDESAISPTSARPDWGAALLAGVVGLVLAVVPHLAVLWAHGTTDFIAHDDDAVYIALGRAPYYGESILRDAYAGRWEGVPSVYGWLPIVPLAKLTRGLGLPLIGMGLVSRAVGGVLFGMALFVLFRRLQAGTAHPVAWALGCTLIGLADPGFIDGGTLVNTAKLAGCLWHGTTPMEKADAIPQYRIVSPLLILPFFLLTAAGLLPEGRKRLGLVVVAGLSLGLCFLMYFYFWTAAVLGLGLALVWFLGLAATRAERREEFLREAGAIGLVLVIGGAIGALQVFGNYRMFSAPEYRPMLERMVKPFTLAPGDPARGMYLRNVWVWGKLAIGLVAILWARLPNLRLIWCLTLAGYLLANSALVTRLDFENFHWAYIYSPAGEVLVLGIAAMALDRLGGRVGVSRLRWLWVLPVAWVAFAGVWRWYEALHAPYAVWASRTIEELRPLRPSLARMSPNSALAGPKEANIGVLNSPGAQLYASPYSWTSLIPDQTLHQRHALNAWLSGVDLATYAKTAGRDKYTDLPRPEWTTEAVGAARARVFEALETRSDPTLLPRLLHQFHPDDLLLPADAPRPRRAGPWRLVRKSARWALWARGGRGR